MAKFWPYHVDRATEALGEGAHGRHRRPKSFRARTVAVLALAGCLACSASKLQGPLLVVLPSQDQPQEEGLIVAIQSQGGDWLSLTVFGGAFTNGSTTSCVAGPATDSLRESVTNVLVYPEDEEVVMDVILIKSSGSDTGNPCSSGTAVKHVIRALRAPVKMDGPGGAGGAAPVPTNGGDKQ